MNAHLPSSDATGATVEQVEELRSYYAHPAVRQRMIAFLGGNDLADASCAYIAADDTVASSRPPRPVSDFLDRLNRGLDISRALWDRETLVVHLDVEYVNFDYPTEAYQFPERIFELQRPVMEPIEDLLREFGIAFLHVLSGRGHHFVRQIRRNSEVFRKLASIAPVPPSLISVNRRPHPPMDECVSVKMGAAFAGLGLVVEFLAHRVKQLAAPRCIVPVEFTAPEVGPRLRDRKMISIDLSEYGDPLHTRTLRVPFSVYHKPAQLRWLIGKKTLQNLPTVVFVPLQGITVDEALLIRCELKKAAARASHTQSDIPIQEEGMERLLNEYMGSPLAKPG